MGSGRGRQWFLVGCFFQTVRQGLLRAGEPSRRVLLTTMVLFRHSDVAGGPGSAERLFGGSPGAPQLWGRQWMPALCLGFGFRLFVALRWRSSSSLGSGNIVQLVPSIHRLRASADWARGFGPELLGSSLHPAPIRVLWGIGDYDN